MATTFLSRPVGAWLDFHACAQGLRVPAIRPARSTPGFYEGPLSRRFSLTARSCLSVFSPCGIRVFSAPGSWRSLSAPQAGLPSARVKPGTSFYPCRLSRSPYAACAAASVRPFERRPIYECGALCTRQGYGRLTCVSTTSVLLSPGPSWAAPESSTHRHALAFNSAPSGISPVSTYFHNATSSFRASATIPTRRLRFPAPPKRARYHALSFDCGW